MTCVGILHSRNFSRAASSFLSFSFLSNNQPHSFAGNVDFSIKQNKMSIPLQYFFRKNPKSYLKVKKINIYFVIIQQKKGYNKNLLYPKERKCKMKKLISVIIPRKKHLKSKKKQNLLKLANFQNPLKPQKLTRRAIINKKMGIFMFLCVSCALRQSSKR